MSREIKFRAWVENDHIKNNIYPYMQESPQFTGSINEIFAESGVQPLNYLHSKVTYMQYTGLKDKNGVEIYEGDILKLCLIDYAEVEEDIFLVRPNKFHGDVCYLESIDEVARGSETDFIEVIGNIHQRPHLLEAQHERS